MNYFRSFWVVLLMLSSLIDAGCGTKYVSYTISPKWDKVKITKVAAVPFAFVPGGGEDGFRSAKVDPHGVELITSMFLHGLEDAGYTVIPFDEETKEQLSPQGTLAIDVIKSVGEKTGAEAVLTGVITRYEEREGGPWAIKKPASIGFEVNLISTADGTILWNGRYAETQKSLVEDLSMTFTFFKRKGKWLTAEELARYGVEDVLETLPKSPLIHPTPVY
jgi:hypothetical protein